MSRTKLSPDDQDELESYEADNEPAIDDEVGTGPESMKKNEVAYSTSGIEKGPEGGFRTTDATNTAKLLGDVRSTKMTAMTTPATTSPEERYAKMIEELKALQARESDQHQAINMLRGGNQIAQAIAYGYGGKIGDGSTQADALTKSASKPVDDLLKQFKMARETNSGRGDLYFTAFKNAEGVDVIGAFDRKTGQLVKELGGKPWGDKILTDRNGEKIIYKQGAGFYYADGPKAGKAVPTGLLPDEAASVKIPSQSNSSVATTVSTEGASPTAQLKPELTYGDYFRTGMILPKEDEMIQKDKEGFEQASRDQIKIQSGLASVPAIAKEAMTNPNAASSLGGIIGSLFEPGKLTDEDAIRYVKESGMENWFKNTYSKLAKGVIRKELADNITRTAQVYLKELDQILQRKAKTMVAATHQRLQNKEVDPNVLAKFYYLPKYMNVKNKTTGETGAIPVENFNPEKYERLP